MSSQRPDATGPPSGKAITAMRLALALLSGAMLGLSFPPSRLGVLACFGLVPLLVALSDVRTIRRGLGYVYVAMLVFHVITLNWTGGYEHGNDPYMMAAGAATMILHPLFYFLPMSAYLFARRHLGEAVALAALPLFWVGYEYSHSLSEWSFPWLTIGNSQTYDIAGIQFISLTGVYGLSFWILCMNCLCFLLYLRLARSAWGVRSRQAVLVVGLIVLLYYLPRLHGALVLWDAPASSGAQEPTVPITVGMVQSNVDPWDKWSRSGLQTLRLYGALTDSLLHGRADCVPDLVLWPETAIPFYAFSSANATALGEIRKGVERRDVPLLTGAPVAVVYEDSGEAPPSAKRDPRTGRRYDAFNAAIFIQPGLDSIAWYGKMKMVPLAERVPYADLFHVFDFLRWGVGIGGWQIGRDTTVFLEQRGRARFSTMICYESTYPDFVAEFVRRGAEFITIITIDSWWGRMSGAFQHRQIATLRAIENRRWIARCAVGGISCYIDPWGRAHDETELFTRSVLCRTISRETDLTIYTRFGDIAGHVSLWTSLLLVTAAAGQRFMRRRHDEAWTQP